jgi:RimJ/RimL family protein N-acetyltransferase
MEPSIEGLPELGYVFASFTRGRSCATEAARAVLGWADDALAPDQIVAIIDVDNDRSIRIADAP